MRPRLLLIVVILAALPGSPPTPWISTATRASVPAPELHAPLPATTAEADRSKSLNASDEQAYLAVVTASYRMAPKVAGLRTIAPGSPLYEDAQGYLKWHEADRIVRAGTAHFRQGRLEQALLCLERALTCDVLGPDARRSVAERQTAWSDVADRLALARRLVAQKKPTKARAQLQQLLNDPVARPTTYFRESKSLLDSLPKAPN